MITNKDIIVVCNKCLKASCYQGIHMCYEAYSGAGTTEMMVEDLKALGYEHSGFWKNTNP